MELAVASNHKDKKGAATEHKGRSTTSAQVHEMEVKLVQLENTLKALKLEKKIARRKKKVDRCLRRRAFWDRKPISNFFAKLKRD